MPIVWSSDGFVKRRLSVCLRAYNLFIKSPLYHILVIHITHTDTYTRDGVTSNVS